MLIRFTALMGRASGIMMLADTERESELMQGDSNHDIPFDVQCRDLTSDVFRDLVRKDLAGGSVAEEQARVYAELGKPDFALAYLLVCSLADADKREILARSFESRATFTVEKAEEFDRKFHRPFPMLHKDATRDRLIASQIRRGLPVDRTFERQAPLV